MSRLARLRNRTPKDKDQKGMEPASLKSQTQPGNDPDRAVAPEIGKPSGAVPVAVWYALTVLATLAGLALMVDSLLQSSATYDEVTYLKVAAHWWRTGDEDVITRQGSPLLFWKVQQAPVLWALDRAGFGAVIDDPSAHQKALLPLVRLWSLSIWVAGLALTALWARLLYGPGAMAMASGLFALSPNLLAHGPLITMETPLLACTTGMGLLFWRFLRTDRPVFLIASAAVGGLAWSCKYTTILFPPMFALVWWLNRWRGRGPRRLGLSIRVGLGMFGFVVVLALTNLIVTGFATAPLSPNQGGHLLLNGRVPDWLAPIAAKGLEIPVPRELAGFATQMRLQGSGGTSYLFGQRRDHGWWYYYPVTLAVKVPLTFWLMVLGRLALGRRARSAGSDGMLPLVIVLFLTISSIGSTRNLGLRYLLPMAPLAIVWVSCLAEARSFWRILAVLGLIGQAAAVASIHPCELAYFNVLAGGPRGGKHILADSNLDWGQGAKSIAGLQARRPEFQDLTFYYFGETDPAHYGVKGRVYQVNAVSLPPGFPPVLRAETAYLAVSASLQHGPWGPSGYFQALDAVRPVVVLDDQTVAIYRVADLDSRGESEGQ